MRKMIHLFFDDRNVSIEVSYHAISQFREQCDLPYKEDLSIDNCVAKIKAMISHMTYDQFRILAAMAEWCNSFYTSPYPEDRIVFHQDYGSADGEWSLVFMVLPDKTTRIVQINKERI